MGEHPFPLAEMCYSEARLQMLGQSQASCGELYPSQATECLLSGGPRAVRTPPPPPLLLRLLRLFQSPRKVTERKIL